MTLNLAQKRCVVVSILLDACFQLPFVAAPIILHTRLLVACMLSYVFFSTLIYVFSSVKIILILLEVFSKHFQKVLHVCIYLQSKRGNETLNFRCFRARWFAFSLNWSFHNESTYIIFLRQIKEFANFARSLRSQTSWNFLIS